ncbi:ATP-grasp domain-containing protein [Nocardia gipuzkoensis]
MKPAIVLMHALVSAKYPAFLDAAKEHDIAVLGTVLDRDKPLTKLFLHQRENDPNSILSVMSDWREVKPDDLDSIIDAIAGWQCEYDVLGVFSMTEEFVRTAAAAADVLGIRGTGLTAAIASRNKHIQRHLLGELSPRWHYVSPHDRPEATGVSALRFPVVCKPSSRSGSSGVQRVDDIRDLNRVMARYPADEVILLEEFVTGQEYSVETTSFDGKSIHHSITIKTTNEIDTHYFVESSHTVAPVDATVADLLTAAADRVLATIQMKTGLSHCEFRLAADGTPRLMEVAVRAGGDAISTIHQLSSGTNHAEILLRALVNKPQPESDRSVRVAREIFLRQHAGRLNGVEAEERMPVNWFDETLCRIPVMPVAHDSEPAVHEVLMAKPRYSYVGEVNSSEDRAGSVIIHAPDRESLEKLTADVIETVKFDIG